MNQRSSTEIISNINFSIEPPTVKEFEHHEFRNCNFADLSQLSFTDCSFVSCNLSNAKAVQARLQNCSFSDCKLLGVNFSGAKEFGFELHAQNCNMDYTSFDKKKLNKSTFKNCRLHGANFTQADLSKSVFDHCDFYEALFSGTNLGGVNLSSSINFLIDPETNNIKKARFALQGLPGLLYRHGIVVE